MVRVITNYSVNCLDDMFNKSHKLYSLLIIFIIVTAIVLVIPRVFLVVHPQETQPLKRNSYHYEWPVHEIDGPIDGDLGNDTGQNIALVFTGRWKFLRIMLPYLCRELRPMPGGVLDGVRFMMLEYDKKTEKSLAHFAKVANKLFQKEVFTFDYMGFDPKAKPTKRSRFAKFKLPFFRILPEVIHNPHNKYFKFDDDIVYIHPGSIAKLIKSQKADCLIHFFNTAGSNWRCSWIHQEMGVYDGLNPQNLIFGHHPRADCGRRKANCGILALKTFLHHFNHSTLSKYFFDIKYITDKQRFTINAFMLDIHTIDMAAMLNSSAMTGSDEEWWTEEYTSKSKRTNCIIGEALIVHFSYSMTFKGIMKTGIIHKFEDLVRNHKAAFNLDRKIWKSLDF